MCADCCGAEWAADPGRERLDFETLLADPLTRLLMQRDGISVREMEALLRAAGAAQARDAKLPAQG